MAFVGLVRGHADGRYATLVRRNRCIAAYLRRFRTPRPDVLVFHQGNITRAHQKAIANESGLPLRFVDVGGLFATWSGTCGPPDESWPMGYCNACRFYFALLPGLMHDMGYAWFMRLDDDSLLEHSEHDIFRLMAGLRADYGTLLVGHEGHGATLSTLPAAVAASAERHRLRYTPGSAVFYTNFVVTRPFRRPRSGSST